MSENVVKRILAIIWLTSEYGGLGARTHMGFGQILVKDLDKESVREGFEKIKEFSKKEGCNGIDLYNMSNFFIIKFRIHEDNDIVKYYAYKPLFVKTRTFPPDWEGTYIPCSFDIKYKGEFENKKFGLRHYFKKEFGKKFAEKLFGYSIRDKKFGGRIFVSHLYKESSEDDYYYLKIWGFPPASLKHPLQGIIDKIKSHVIKDIFGDSKSEVVMEETGEELIRRLTE